MVMATDEILAMYREAKYPKKEIVILTDLNNVSVAAMRNFLQEHGCDIPEDKRFGKKVNKMDETKQTAEVPESIKKILNERRAHLVRQIRQMQAEVDDINSFIGVYKGEKE